MKKLETIIREEYNKIKLEQRRIFEADPEDSKVTSDIEADVQSDNEKTTVDTGEDDGVEYSRKDDLRQLHLQYNDTELNNIRNSYKEHWPNKTLEKVLYETYKALPTSVGNTYAFILPLTTESSIKGGHDWLRFYDDGELYSYQHILRFNYKLKGNRIYLDISGTVDPAEEWVEIVPTNKQTPLGWHFSEVPALKSEIESAKEKEASDDTIDTIQTIMDWLGWIPGIGDIIDVINAIIYFVREKYLDGILSLLAVIPFVGSALKTSLKVGFKSIEKVIKPVFKTMNKVGKIKNPKNLSKTMEAGFISSWKKGDLSASDADSIADGLKEVQKYMRKSTGYIKKVPLVSSSSKKYWIQWLDNWGNNLKAVRDGAEKAGKKIRGIEKAKGLIGKPFTMMSGNLATLTNKMTPKARGKMLKVLDSTKPGGRQYFLKNMKNVADDVFTKALKNSNDPSLVYSIHKMGLANKGGLKIDDLFKSSLNRIKNSGTDLSKMDIPKGAYEKLSFMKKHDPTQYASFAEDVAFQAQKYKHPSYQRFLNDALADPKVVFGGKIKQIGDFAEWAKFLDFRNEWTRTGLKSWDIWSNELGEIFEEMGLDYHDDPNSVLLSGLGYLWRFAHADSYEEYAKIKQAYQQQISSWYTSVNPFVEYSKQMIGLGSEEQTRYSTDKWTSTIPELEGQEKADTIVNNSQNPDSTKKLLNKFKTDYNVDMGDFQPYEIEAEVTDEA